MRDGDSVISRLEGAGIDCPRIRLPGAQDPSVTDDADRSAAVGHHVIHGEIGRGGVGSVLRCSDVDLGRDVAMKVVLDRHLGNPEVVRRFVEEARIGGQLQHPGIAPVYELGLQDDRRPFFTMKLVEGETLAVLLENRGSLTDDRRRILSVFARTCRTVAYAHSRSVVHRDLKPSNVMVGAYGEVQVLDWGLAKVMGRTGEAPPLPESSSTRSEAGSGEVMGTIAYMSPEQAGGRSELLDQRTDVFSLGAVLLEILTGAPPYCGELADRFRQARAGDLTAALARLRESKAEENLAQVCLDCLSPEPSSRPRSAGLIADHVEAHLSAVAERAHRFEVETIERRAEAEQNRIHAEEARSVAEDWRRRKRWAWSMGLSAAVALAVALAGWLWVQQGRSERTMRADLGVRRILVTASTLHGKGDLAGAVAAARRADELAEEASEAIRSHTRGRKDELVAEETRARRERELCRLLTDAVLNHDPPIDEILKRAGTLLDSAGSGGVPEDLIVALDLAQDPRTSLLDPDPLRDRIRRAGRDELRKIAGTVDPDETPVRTMHLLAARLDSVSERDAAIVVLTEALRRHPGDFWVQVGLAECVPERAVRSLSAAAALRPESAGVLRRLTEARAASGPKDD